MSKARTTMGKIVEQLGLNWFAILIGKPAFEDAPLPYPRTLQEVRDRFGDLREKSKLDDAINYCADLLKREDNRSDKVESKAITLTGITGIAAGFITGFASFLLDPGKIPTTPILVSAAVLYILIVISLMLTILLAIKVITVRDYRFTYPSANDIFDLLNTPLDEVKRERAASLFYSFAQNVQVVNRKASYLRGAQFWFRNSIFLLLGLTLLLAIYTLFRATFSHAGVSLPTPVPTANTPQLLATQTSTSTSTPTITWTHTPIITPTHTSTQIPTTTPTDTPTLTPTPTSTATALPSPTIEVTPVP